MSESDDDPYSGPPQPQNLAAEMNVLGVMMLSEDAAYAVTEILRGPEDFFRPAHALIYDAILTASRDGHGTGPVAVMEELRRTQTLSRAGGPTYLHTLIESVSTVASGPYFAQVVAGHARLRRVIEAGTRVTQMGYAGDPDDPRATEDQAAEAVLAATDARDTGGVQVIGDTVQAAMDAVEAAQNRSEPVGMSTGLAPLDDLVRLRPGEMIVVAANSGTGKSILAVDMARAVAVKAGQPALVFSLEMSMPQILTRILAAESGVSLNRLTEGGMTEDDWTRLARRVDPLLNAPLWIDDTPGLDMPAIRSKARRIHKRHGPLGLIVVDYLQLMSSGERVENRQVEVAGFSRAIKLLAKELDVPVVAVSQLNRGAVARGDKTPQLSDLRESAAIEHDADAVILADRPEMRERHGEQSVRAGEIDLYVPKNRHNRTGMVTAVFQGHYARIVAMADHW